MIPALKPSLAQKMFWPTGGKVILPISEDDVPLEALAVVYPTTTEEVSAILPVP